MSQYRFDASFRSLRWSSVKSVDWVGFLTIVLGFVLTFRPPDLNAIEPGLDPSWQLALNELAARSHQFGADLAFTFGPLGVVLHPIAGFGFENRALAFAIAIHAAVWAFATEAWRRWGSISGLIIFAVTFVLARTLGWIASEAELQLLQLLFGISIALEPQRRARATKVILLAASLPVVALMKFTLVLSGGVILGVSLLVVGTQRGREAAQDAAAAVAAVAASSVLVASLAFASWQDTFTWLRYSLDLAEGYSQAMSLIGHADEVVVAIALILCIVAIATVGRRLRRSTALTTMIALPLVFLAFKQGFVRQDTEHTFQFFPFMIVLPGALALYDRSLQSLASLVIVACLTAFLWRADLGLKGRLAETSTWFAQTTTAEPARQAVQWTADSEFRNTTLTRLRERSKVALTGARLPQRWLEAIGTRSVLVMPFDLVLCRANALNCVYPRTLQTYAAFTASLDRWSAEAIEAAARPEFVLASFTDIDGRHPWLAEPATWRAVIHGYALLDADVRRNLFLLRKHAPTRERSAAVEESVLAEADGWYPVSAANGRLVTITMKRSIAATLRGLLFRNDPVQLELEFMDGTRRRFRILPSTASAGLEMSNVPILPAQARDALAGNAHFPVRRFRVVGPGATEYTTVRVALAPPPH